MTAFQQKLCNETKTGQYAASTTAQDLAKIKNHNDWSYLHDAACFAHFPRDTTAALLKTTTTKEGISAWDRIYDRLRDFPTYILTLPPHLLQEDIQLAITTIQTAIKTDPDLQSKAAIWLGQVLAGAQTQHHRTTPTP